MASSSVKTSLPFHAAIAQKVQIVVDFPYLSNPDKLNGGLLGIFYRNCLKVEDMIFNPLYKKVLKPWALGSNRFLSFIVVPLGFCIYCSTLELHSSFYLLFLTSWEGLPK